MTHSYVCHDSYDSCVRHEPTHSSHLMASVPWLVAHTWVIWVMAHIWMSHVLPVTNSLLCVLAIGHYASCIFDIQSCIDIYVHICICTFIYICPHEKRLGFQERNTLQHTATDMTPPAYSTFNYTHTYMYIYVHLYVYVYVRTKSVLESIGCHPMDSKKLSVRKYIYTYKHTYTYICIIEWWTCNTYKNTYMGWLRLVGSIKW